ncbi:MAG: sodium:proton antiporter [Cytophagales bacterium]|nr:sodium:proton antiporter [Cytophagales bacterium]
MLLLIAGSVAPVNPWLCLPFGAMILMIAIFPLFFGSFWHKYFGHIAIAMGGGMVLYYLLVLQNTHTPLHTLFEYVQFVSLIAALYFAANVIKVSVHHQGLPWINLSFLLGGAIISNFIGTTGASILLINPFLYLNKGRVKPFHVAFFIFMVSNVGGALTPIGDPPLFLGFLRGVPFFWSTQHLFLPWLVALIALSGIFFCLDRRELKKNPVRSSRDQREGSWISLSGKRSLPWLAIIIGSVFLDPNLSEHIPHFIYEGARVSYLREIIMIACAAGAYKTASPQVMAGGGFNFFPIREVALLFLGIFGTMMPALELIRHISGSPEVGNFLGPSVLYWTTGFLSGFLDNAPTYLTFLTASMASHQADVHQVSHVVNFALGDGLTDITLKCLKAISLSSVFFGAFTYVGNGPNLMISSIARAKGISMPSFFGYLFRFSIPFLLPVLFLIWYLFFVLI